MVRFLRQRGEEVKAYGACLVDPAIGEAGDVDICIITLRFKNGGAGGLVDNSRQAVADTTSG